ncbi:MAG: diguanylate cyclase [Gammaproteobacteria bacterium]
MNHANVLLLIFLLLGGIASAFADIESAEDVIDLQLRWHHQFQFAGYYAAVEKGFYREEGLQVRLHPGDRAHQPVNEVLSGRAQYAEGNSEVLFQRLQGKPLIALAAIFQHSPSILLVRKDSGITSVHELAGKKVMLMNMTEDADFLTMFLNEGIAPSQLRILPSSYQVDDLISGKVDAFNAYATNEPFLLKELNIPYIIIEPSNYRVDFYSDVLFTTEAEVRDHRERVESVRRATLRGWRYAMDHPDEIIELLISKYHVDKTRAHLEFEAAEMRKLIFPDIIEIGHMNPERWDYMADTFVNAGLIKSNKNLKGFIYNAKSKKLPGWIVPVLVASALMLLAVLWVACYLLQLNRRLAITQTDLRNTNSILSSEIEGRKAVESTLRESEKRFRSLFENMLGGVAYCQLLYQDDQPCDFIFLEVNATFEQLTGFQDVVGKRVSEVMPGIKATNPELFEIYGRVAWSEHPEKFETYVKPLDAWFSVSVYGAGSACFVMIFDNITERKRLQQTYEYMAQIDDLTGLANRRHFMEQAEVELARAFRYGGDLSLLMLDLDHFKKINDTYGHQTGDLVLKKFSVLCQATLREVDLIGRLGGEEFVILLPETGEKDAVEVADRLRELIACSSVELETGLTVPFTVSIGVAAFGKSCCTMDALLQKADKALYQAKAEGRNRVYAGCSAP